METNIYDTIRSKLFPDWDEEKATECFLIIMDCSECEEMLMAVPFNEEIAKKAIKILENDDEKLVGKISFRYSSRDNDNKKRTLEDLNDAELKSFIKNKKQKISSAKRILGKRKANQCFISLKEQLNKDVGLTPKGKEWIDSWESICIEANDYSETGEHTQSLWRFSIQVKDDKIFTFEDLAGSTSSACWSTRKLSFNTPIGPFKWDMSGSSNNTEMAMKTKDGFNLKDVEMNEFISIIDYTIAFMGEEYEHGRCPYFYVDGIEDE